MKAIVKKIKVGTEIDYHDGKGGFDIFMKEMKQYIGKEIEVESDTVRQDWFYETESDLGWHFHSSWLEFA